MDGLLRGEYVENNAKCGTLQSLELQGSNQKARQAYPQFWAEQPESDISSIF